MLAPGKAVEVFLVALLRFCGVTVCSVFGQKNVRSKNALVFKLFLIILNRTVESGLGTCPAPGFGPQVCTFLWAYSFMQPTLCALQ
jgi:hypothetical protein